jgi:hypothetical protein
MPRNSSTSSRSSDCVIRIITAERLCGILHPRYEQVHMSSGEILRPALMSLPTEDAADRGLARRETALWHVLIREEVCGALPNQARVGWCADQAAICRSLHERQIQFRLRSTESNGRRHRKHGRRKTLAGGETGAAGARMRTRVSTGCSL